MGFSFRQHGSVVVVAALLGAVGGTALGLAEGTQPIRTAAPPTPEHRASAAASSSTLRPPPHRATAPQPQASDGAPADQRLAAVRRPNGGERAATGGKQHWPRTPGDRGNGKHKDKRRGG